MRLRYTPAARADLRAMRDYIIHTLKNPSAAQRLTAKIVESCARLKDQPRMGAALSEKTGRDTDLRYLVCGDQIAFYRVEEGKANGLDHPHSGWTNRLYARDFSL